MFVECRHIMPRGAKCKAPALRGRPYCYFHDKLHAYTRDGLRDDKGAGGPDLRNINSYEAGCPRACPELVEGSRL
jgi:hypothetical protein